MPEYTAYNAADGHSGHGDQNTANKRSARSRTASPEAGRSSPHAMFNPFYTGRPRTPVTHGSKMNTVDRQEIIRKIKSNGSRPASPEIERVPSSGSSGIQRASPVPWKRSDGNMSCPKTPEPLLDSQAAGLQIERPRSALHSGDFREKESADEGFGRFGLHAKYQPTPALATSPIVPWHSDFPAAAIKQIRDESRPSSIKRAVPAVTSARARTVSNTSLATSFVYKPPTSPLVQSSRPDTPELNGRRDSRSPDRSRRHTFSPQSFQKYRSALIHSTRSDDFEHPQNPTYFAQRNLPYQAHQPKRSLHSISFPNAPLTPPLGSRRPSLSDSPLHHAPMVGSYEESILRGRMSTQPSKPLNFVAQIGVLGKGDCKANLRCPPHVSVPFPAVFYSYGSGNKGVSAGDQPSPYVGLIDLENDLRNSELPNRRPNRLQVVRTPESSRPSSHVRDECSVSEIQMQKRKIQKQERRSTFPKAPPGGSYRIPQQGQLQIVIKNPNKTAVKLFLIPYDLTDMEPGQKTFIRQRSYSAGPIIDMPLSQRKNYGTDRPEAALSASDDPNDRPMLRYLIHLHICCTSKGRYFLYKTIRVVFANRVPDGKEKLRNEIQQPEPRYSGYKPNRDSLNATPSKDPSRRRSEVNFSATPSSEPHWPAFPRPFAHSLPSADYDGRFGSPTQTLPSHSMALPTLESRPASRQMSDGMDVDSDRSQEPLSFYSPLSSPESKDRNASMRVLPRLDEPFTFEREMNRERRWPKPRSESLLSQRLMDLAFQGQEDGVDEM